MESLASTWPAPAKLNLFLHVIGRRADGYHQLQSALQFTTLEDTLHIQATTDGQLTLTHDGLDVPTEDNLILQAARRLREMAGKPQLGATLHLDKRIPLGAGLGGGSSDAATTLVALNRAWSTQLTPDELAKLGASLGADIPVFVYGHSAWVEGIGEECTPMDWPTPWYLILVPPVHSDTKTLFQHPDLPRNTPPLLRSEQLPDGAHNDCESLACALYPPIQQALRALRELAPSARLTGTGAAVFAAFPSQAAAQTAARLALPKSVQRFVVQGRNQLPWATESST